MISNFHRAVFWSKQPFLNTTFRSQSQKTLNFPSPENQASVQSGTFVCFTSHKFLICGESRSLVGKYTNTAGTSRNALILWRERPIWRLRLATSVQSDKPPPGAGFIRRAVAFCPRKDGERLRFAPAANENKFGRYTSGVRAVAGSNVLENYQHDLTNENSHYLSPHRHAHGHIPRTHIVWDSL